MQPPVNTAFDPGGELKPAYTKRLEKVIAAADRLGMVVSPGFPENATSGWTRNP